MVQASSRGLAALLRIEGDERVDGEPGDAEPIRLERKTVTTVVSGRRRTTDRRMRPRFEVVGDLFGTLQIVRPLAVRDIGPGGALVESDRRWEVGSIHSILVNDGAETGAAQICVKHVRDAPERPGRYLIGIAFVSLSPTLADEIARWAAADVGGSALERS